MVAFRSAMQVIYEQLMVAFGDSVATLRALQEASTEDQAHGQGNEGAVEHAPEKAEMLARADEMEQTIAALLEMRDLPSRQGLTRLQRDLDALDAALDRRLADLEKQRQQSVA
jgi:flagellar motility protein MotE (MotC chaperone)